MEITAVIIAKNEEKNIARAITSAGFCQEVVVADDVSTDKTAAIARETGARVVSLPGNLDFPHKRVEAMKHVDTEWVLFLDADEEITPELKQEIERDFPGTEYAAFNLRRRDFWWGRELKYGETKRARNQGICRLINMTSGHFMGEVHEQWIPHGKTKTLNHFINHYPHPTLNDFISDVNTYSTMRARELQSLGVKPSMYKLIVYPLAKFVLTYFVYLGFLDGAPGFIYSFLMSFHSFLVRAKLYQYTKLDG